MTLESTLQSHIDSNNFSAIISLFSALRADRDRLMFLNQSYLQHITSLKETRRENSNSNNDQTNTLNINNIRESLRNTTKTTNPVPPSRTKKLKSSSLALDL